MFHCPDCWDTPCTCGTQYKHFTKQQLADLIKVLTDILASPRPRFDAADLVVGDKVEPTPECRSRCKLFHCGTGKHPFAVVAKLYPFTLVSANGSMVWTGWKASDLVAIGKASTEEMKCVLDRILVGNL
jgi:hypothetical protein